MAKVGLQIVINPLLDIGGIN